MIKEDYVSFETAKLLKEKRFNEIACGIYDCGDESVSFNNPEIRWNEKDLPFIAAPTMQMAMKWLREVHNIHITICIGSNVDNPNLHFYTPRITKFGDAFIEYLEVFADSEYDTPESAIDDAIRYCLENLV